MRTKRNFKFFLKMDKRKLTLDHLDSILKVFRLKAVSAKKQMGDFTFIETDLDEAPFSFFSNLFWKKSISMEDESGRKILQHELAHIREKHSWDRLFSQLICSIFWMNPFNWIMQKELQNIHEFIADRDAVGAGEVDAFAKMLLQTYYGNHFLNPSHSFYYSSIKRRIIMLTTSNTPKYAYLRKVAVLPLVAITLVLFSIQLSAQKPKPKKELATQYTVTMRPDSTTFSDPKTGKKVFSVATRDMPPPPPPAGSTTRATSCATCSSTRWRWPAWSRSWRRWTGSSRSSAASPKTCGPRRWSTRNSR